MARQYCSGCNLVTKACICSSVVRQANVLPVFILRHPDELRKTLGTAKLLRLGLDNCHLHTTVDCSHLECQRALTQLGVQAPMLLYVPAKTGNSTAEVIELDVSKDAAVNLGSDRERLQAYDGLVVLDGTWRNTKELYMRNPWLSTLPLLALRNPPESRYRIRKSQLQEGLATIEAVGLVLSVVQHDFSLEHLLKPFHTMIEYQIKKMGHQVFEQNYNSPNA